MLLKSLKKTLIIILFFTISAHSNENNATSINENNSNEKELYEVKLKDEIKSTVKSEIDSNNNDIDTKFNIQKENLEFKNELVNWFLAFLGILITVVGLIIPFMSYRLKKEIEKQKTDTDTTINNLVNQTKEKLADYEQKAEGYLNSIKSKKNSIEDIFNSLVIDSKEKSRYEIYVNNIIKDENSNFFQVEMAKALKHYINDEYQEAIDGLNFILKEFIKEMSVEILVKVYYKIAYSYGQLQDFDRSIEFYNKGLMIESDQAEAIVFSNLGAMHQANNDDEKALSSYQKAINKNDKDKGSWYNLAMLYTKKGQFDDAIKIYNQVIDNHSDFTDCFENLIELLIFTNQLKESEDKLNLLKTKQTKSLFGITFLDIVIKRINHEWDKKIDETFDEIKTIMNNNPQLISWSFEEWKKWLENEDLLKIKKKDKNFIAELINKIEGWME